MIYSKLSELVKFLKNKDRNNNLLLIANISNLINQFIDEKNN